MNNLDLQARTNLLLAEEEIKGYKNSDQYIEWAIWAMEAGYTSTNLDILAGLDNTDVFEIDKYFRRAVTDFCLNINIEKIQLLDFFLIYKIEEVLSNPAILDKTISILDDTVYRTSYFNNNHLDFFFYFDEDENLEGISREEYALREFKAFMKELEPINYSK